MPRPTRISGRKLTIASSTDIFAVESEIAKTIADTLQAKLTGSEKERMAAQPTSDTIAYELYHKGRSLWGHRSGDNIPRAISFYEQAIAKILITPGLTPVWPAPMLSFPIYTRRGAAPSLSGRRKRPR